MAKPQIVTVKRVGISFGTGWAKYKVYLDQEIYLKYSKIERDYIYTEAQDELEAYQRATAWLNQK